MNSSVNGTGKSRTIGTTVGWTSMGSVIAILAEYTSKDARWELGSRHCNGYRLLLGPIRRTVSAIPSDRTSVLFAALERDEPVKLPREASLGDELARDTIRAAADRAEANGTRLIEPGSDVDPVTITPGRLEFARARRYTPTLMITEIAFTAYPSNDVAATRAWYERYLGLTFAGPYVEDGVEKYNEAQLGDSCFSLMAAEWVGRDPGTAAGVVFEVDDIEATVAQLRAHGLIVEDIYETPVCRLTSLSDPEGNKVSLHQRNLGR
jgi:predicted enzyme related to lactoylglutathione lyase